MAVRRSGPVALGLVFVVGGCTFVDGDDETKNSESAINADDDAKEVGTFKITNYVLPKETSFKTEEEFLCSGKGVAMQGTGVRKNGAFVTYVGGGGGWCNKYEKLCDCASAKFKNTDGVYGSSGKKLTKNVSIAVDTKVIPHGRSVWIAELKRWFRAEDTGGAIRGKHIDVYTADANPSYRMTSRVFVSTVNHAPTDPGPGGAQPVLADSKSTEPADDDAPPRESSPPPPPPPPSKPEGDVDGGTGGATPQAMCWAEEIGEWVPHGDCAEAIDFSWWQCASGKWFSSTAISGPAGECTSIHPYPED